MTRPALTILQPQDPDGPHQVTALDCIGAIVAAMGNLDLAAERLFGPRDPRDHTASDPKAQLIATIADDPSSFDELSKQLRILTLIDTFSKTQTLAHVVNGTLEKQEPAVLAKLYTQMLAVLTTLTDDHTQNVNSSSTSVNLNIQEQVLRNLSPEVREAIKVFQQRPSLTPPDHPHQLSVSPAVEPSWSGGDPPPNIATDDL